MDIPPQSPPQFSPPPQMPPSPTMMRPNARLKDIVTFFAGLAIIIWTLGFYFNCFGVPQSSSQKAATGPVGLDPQAAYNKGQYDTAIAQARKVLSAGAPNALKLQMAVVESLALSQKGNDLWQASVYGPQAVDAANQAIGFSGSSASAYLALGFADEIQGKYADAHTAYQKAISLDGKNAAALSADAHIYELEGNIAKAKTGYQAALKVNPNSYAANLGLGRVLLAEGDKNGSLARLMPVYQNDQNSAEKSEAAYDIGVLFMTLHGDNLSLAQGMFQEATTINNHYMAAWLAQGAVFYMESTGKGVTAKDKSSYLAGSTNAMFYAVINTNFDPKLATLPVGVAHDLAIFGNASSMAAALNAASMQISQRGGLKATDAQMLQPRFGQLATLISANMSK